jgi:hypothetical protein
MQRYQQIAVQALAACDYAGQPSPPGFLDELARQAQAGVAPDPRHVLAELIGVLRQRGAADPVTSATRLLPDVSFP